MVERRLNKPVAKIGSHPIFWFRQVGASWHCRKCGSNEKAGSVAFEICTRKENHGLEKTGLCHACGSMNALKCTHCQAYTKEKNDDKAEKLYICLKCAEAVIDESLSNIRLCKQVGPEGYMIFTKV